MAHIRQDWEPVVSVLSILISSHPFAARCSKIPACGAEYARGDFPLGVGNCSKPACCVASANILVEQALLERLRF